MSSQSSSPELLAAPTREPHRSSGVAIAAALLVTVLWSSSWVLIRVGLDDADLPPLTFAAARYGLAATLLVAWVATHRTTRAAAAGLGRNGVGWLVALGVVAIAVTQGAQFVAIAHQPAATTSLVLALTPLAVGALAGSLLGERTTPRQLVGAGLVGLGAWCYSAGSLGATRVGMVAALVGLAANAGGSLLGRRVNRELGAPAVVVTAGSMSVGALGLGVAAALTESAPQLGARAVMVVVWLAVVNTAAAFTLWNWSLRHLSAVQSAGINNTMLVQIGALGWIFLGEPLGVAGTVGIVVVTAGILLTQLAGVPVRPARAARRRGRHT